MRPAEVNPASDDAGGNPGDSGLAVEMDAKSVEDRAGDGFSSLGDATGPTAGLDAAGELGGEGGTGKVEGGAGSDASALVEDATPPADDGSLVNLDTMPPIDHLPIVDSGIPLLLDAVVDSTSADRRIPEDVVDTSVPTDAAGPIFTVNAGTDKTVCTGWPIVIGASAQGGTAPYTYAWTANPTCAGCISNPTAAQPTVTPLGTTTFTVTAMDALGAITVDAVKVTVQTDIANAGPEPLSVDPATALKIGTPANTGYTYAWICDRPTCTLSSPSEAQPSVSPIQSTLYILTVTSSEGCTATDSATVWVNLPASTTPAEGEDSYPANALLLVQFGADVLVSSITTTSVTLRESVSGTPVEFSWDYNTSLRTLTVEPTGTNYRASVGQYTLTLVGGAAGIVSDDAIRPQQLPVDLVVNFSVVAASDSTRPTIVSRTPTSNATGVGVNAAVSVVFSEVLDPDTVTATSFAVSTGMTSVTGTLSYNAKTSTVLFVPTTPLAGMTTYMVRLSGIQDLAGNSATTTSWYFTTGLAPDTTAPTVITVSPTSGATGASTIAKVSMVFSEAMDATSLTGITLVADAMPVAGSVAYNAGTGQATFTPTAPLAKQTIYTLTVTGAKDLAGNAMAAPFTSTFTTANTLFVDSFESGTSNWTMSPTPGLFGAQPWGLSTDTYQSPNYSLTDSPAGNYSASANTSAASDPIDVTGLTSVSLSYWLSGQTQSSYDFLRVEYSTNGTTWNTVTTWSGTMAAAFHTHTISLPAGATSLQIRFRLTSNTMLQYDGVYIDDVTVQTD